MSTPEMQGGRGSWLPLVISSAVLAVIALLLIVLPAPAPAQLARCPNAQEWAAPVTSPPVFTDNNAAVYVGGNYDSMRSTQTEGLLVVMGDASFGDTTEGESLVGSIEFGAQVAPTPATGMLFVGGDLSVTSTTRLGIGASSAGGGEVSVGGTVSALRNVDTNGAVLRDGLGPEAVVGFRQVGTLLSQQSQQFRTDAATGEVTATEDVLYFAGDGSSAVQVFTIPAEAVATASRFDFRDIPDESAIAINVLGEAASLQVEEFDDSGVRIDQIPSAALASLSARILWNFPDARTVTIAGPAVVLGSILVPNGDVVVTTATNGRIYVGGDLTISSPTAAHRNYAWIGSPALACQAQRASLRNGTERVIPPIVFLLRLIGAGVLIALVVGVVIVLLVHRDRRMRSPHPGEGLPSGG
jgi:choice-of-anchor A domain-containing protein